MVPVYLQVSIARSTVRMALAVAAIDFGTTYSGWAFSFKHEYERDPLKVSAKQWSGGQQVSMKAPTSVLIDASGKTLVAFGYDAESKYQELMAESKHGAYYFFNRFKMMLYGKLDIERDVTLLDFAGKSLSAKRVFTLTIKYLVDDMKGMCDRQIANEAIKDEEIHWVLTVPAIWDDGAKQFMREAAQEAGIAKNKLSIALEPEAASIYCRHLPVEKGSDSLSTFKSGTQYLVLDAGGGTVDITIHEIQNDGRLKELHRASGGDWGGTKINDEFEQFLGRLFGDDTMRKFKTENLEDHTGMMRDFEIKKRILTPEQTGLVTLHFPASLGELVKKERGMEAGDFVAKSSLSNKVTLVKDKLRFQAYVLTDLFTKQCKSIIDHVDDLVSKPDLNGVKTIVMVGGFSESPILQQKMKSAFKSKGISTIVPREAGLAVLKGAVIYGHSPDSIAERVCRYTYGNEVFPYKFDIHARKGQKIKVGYETPEIIRTPLIASTEQVSVEIYSSESENPTLVTQPGCNKIGELKIPNPDKTSPNDEDRALGITFIFGGTEIEVKVVTKKTGRVDRTFVDFLK